MRESGRLLFLFFLLFIDHMVPCSPGGVVWTACVVSIMIRGGDRELGSEGVRKVCD